MPSVKHIPYGKQVISEDDFPAVTSVLRSDHLTQGPQVPLFETAIANYCGASYAVASNSATSALHIACLALGLQHGDLLWTSPISFVASANCALYCGAKVDFVDIDQKTYNMSVESLEKKLILAKSNGQLPKIIIPVHLTGQPCDMKEIYRLSKIFGFKIIEDASHAIGGKYESLPIGNCKFSDITIFSFHPVKIITSGEGGLATTNDCELAKKMFLLRSHGINKDQENLEYHSDGPWYYEQQLLGFNYRMTELQASLGKSQLKRIDSFIEGRHSVAKIYNESFKDLPITIPFQADYGFSAFHLYVVRIDPAGTRLNRLKLFEELRKHEIGVNLHYIPIYRHPYYSKLGYNSLDFPNSEKYYQEAISLPIFPSMSIEETNYIVKTVLEILAS